MEFQPKVSIICVTKNVAKDLDRCIESIFAQTYPNFELIIQDAQSRDGTIDCIQKWSHVVTHWKSEPDNGIYDAMNKALGQISGDWVYFLGADDILCPDFSTMIENDIKDNRFVYYGNVLWNGKKYDGEFSAYKLTYLNICQQAIFYPRSVFEKYKFDTKYKSCADYLLNMQLYHDPAYQFVYKDRLIAHYNSTGYSSHQKDYVFMSDQKKLVRKYFKFWIYLRYLNRESKKHRKIRRKTDIRDLSGSYN